MSAADLAGEIADVRRELEQERRDRDRAIRVACDAVAERLEGELGELERRIDEVHSRALRELTHLIAGGHTA